MDLLCLDLEEENVEDVGDFGFGGFGGFDADCGQWLDAGVSIQQYHVLEHEADIL